MLLTTLVALTLAAAPAPTTPTCQAPTHTGSFRITAVTRDSSSAKIGMILLENVEGCLEATLITDEGGPAIIDNAKLDHGTLTGLVRMHKGDAKIAVRFTDNGLEGTIGEGKSAWQLAGRRTSDPDVRVGSAK